MPTLLRRYLRPLAASLAGAAFFAALYAYTPPFALQSEDVTRLRLGAVGAVIAGAALVLASGQRRMSGVPYVVACAFVGAVLYAFVIPWLVPSGRQGVWVAQIVLPVFSFFMLVLPAIGGAWLASRAREFVAGRIRSGRRRDRE